MTEAGAMKQKKKQGNLRFYGILSLLFLVLSVGSIYFVFFHDGKLALGDDIRFHLSRIEGLTLALRHGDYFPRINYFFKNGIGYASSIFYSDIFLYPAAFMRLAGWNAPETYIIYMVIINFCTFMISYSSFFAYSRNKQQSLFFAVMYGLASYRLSDVVMRAALGEVLALMVLPIAFYGLLEIVRGNFRKWYYLSIGMAGLFFAHILTTIIFCLFLVFFLLLNGKKLWQEKSRIYAVVKAAVVTIGIVATNFFPMIEQMQFQKLKYATNPTIYLQKAAGSVVDYVKSSVLNQGHNNLGILTFILLIYLLIRIRKLSIVDRQLILLSVIFLFLATDLFPHTLFHQTVFNSIQFPWRYFTIVTLCVLWVAADILPSLLPENDTVKKVVPIFIMCAGVVLSLNYQLRFDVKRLYEYKAYIYTLEEPFSLGGGNEYLPSEMNNTIPSSGLITTPQTGEITNMERKYDHMSFDYHVTEPTRITFPIIDYKGYKVRQTGTGTSSAIYKSKKYPGYAEIKVEGEGHIDFWYEGTWIQKLSFYCSLFATTGFVILIGISNGRDKKAED